MRVAGFGIRVGAVCVFSFVFSSTLDDTLVVAVGGEVALGERVVAGSEVTYSVMSVQARLPFASVKETSAGCCVTVFDVLSVVVVGTVVTRERRDVWATLTCSAANCIVRMYINRKENYSPSGTSGLFFPTRISKYPPRTTRETWSAISSCR